MAPTENETQNAAKKTPQTLGFWVADTSQGYRRGSRRNRSTRVTKGIPDLYAIHETRQLFVWIEVKGPDTKITPEQFAWAERIYRAGGHSWIIRSTEELADHLATLGFEIELTALVA
jgi:hypothetical protein